MERAKAISVGSLSPTINWRTLASEEFALPPLDEQNRIAATLRETDRGVHALLALVEAVQVVQASEASAALAPHRERTLQRMGSEQTVLCIQDGTRVNFTRRGQTQGLGVIGTGPTRPSDRGGGPRSGPAHDAGRQSRRGPVGGASGRVRRAPLVKAPDPDRKGSKPREERKSFRWVEGLRDCGQAAQRMPETRVVCTMDREADFLDLFIERREHAPQVDLLVRAKVDRVLGKDTTPDGHQVSRRLFDQVRSSPARATCTIEVNRLSARVKASKQARKNPRASRVADTTLRYQSVELPCPGAAPVKLWVVHAREEHPPPDAEPLEWFVLTTLRVTSTADAQRVLQWYALRWRIEDYFRILKSGCKVEELQHHTAERLERAIAIKMVVGWRIQLMVRLGRELPELPSELLFSDGELRVLATFGRSRKLSPPARLGEAVELVARLGGWLGRPREPPGAQLMWHRLYSARGHDLRLRATRRIRMTSSRASQVPRSVVGQGQG